MSLSTVVIVLAAATLMALVILTARCFGAMDEPTPDTQPDDTGTDFDQSIARWDRMMDRWAE